MWINRFTKYLLQHRYQTIAFTFVITFVPIVGIIGILIAALMTLCKSVYEGAILTVAATLPYLISFFLTGHEETFPLVVYAAVGVAVLSNVLTWVFAVMLRRQTSWSVILQIAALLGVLVVSVVHLAYPNVVTWWGNELQAYYNQAKAVASMMKPTQVSGVFSSDAQLETINSTKQFATGLMAAGILFNAVLQLIVARWWQAIVFSPGSLQKELHRIRLSQLAGLLFVFSLVLSYLGNSVVLDIMPILYTLFGAAGLSLIHYLIGLLHSPMAWFWLSLIYITLILSLPISLVLVPLVALVDIWLDVRKQLKKMKS